MCGGGSLTTSISSVSGKRSQKRRIHSSTSSRLFGLRQAADPARLLAAPDEVVLLERDVVVLGVLVHRVERRPVHLVARPFDGAPLARVLRRDLIPVHAEVRADLAAGVDVADELLERRRRSARARRAGRPAAPAPPAAPPRRPPAPARAPPPPRLPPRPAAPPAARGRAGAAAGSAASALPPAPALPPARLPRRSRQRCRRFRPRRQASPRHRRTVPAAPLDAPPNPELPPVPAAPPPVPVVPPLPSPPTVSAGRHEQTRAAISVAAAAWTRQGVRHERGTGAPP